MDDIEVITASAVCLINVPNHLEVMWKIFWGKKKGDEDVGGFYLRIATEEPCEYAYCTFLF